MVLSCITIIIFTSKCLTMYIKFYCYFLRSSTMPSINTMINADTTISLASTSGKISVNRAITTSDKDKTLSQRNQPLSTMRSVSVIS
jgi:hypothetical protein